MPIITGIPQITLRDVKEIGKVDAEEDAVLTYFVETSAVEELQQHSKCLVLGRKGSGKTALVRYFSENQGTSPGISRAISLRGYPWNVHAARKDVTTTDVDCYISSWRYLIAVQLATMVSTQAELFQSEEISQIRTFLKDNYGGSSPELKLIMHLRR